MEITSGKFIGALTYPEVSLLEEGRFPEGKISTEEQNFWRMTFPEENNVSIEGDFQNRTRFSEEDKIGQEGLISGVGRDLWRRTRIPK